MMEPNGLAAATGSAWEYANGFGMRPEVRERDDAALLRGVSRGDEESLAALYDRHAGWLTVRLTRRCALPDVVDQAIQDTFLALWREAGQLPR